jgi:hypothetical protein
LIGAAESFSPLLLDSGGEGRKRVAASGKMCPARGQT